jgi:hypothetical protein
MAWARNETKIINVERLDATGYELDPYKVTYEITWTNKDNGPFTIKGSQAYYARDELDAYNKCMRDKS